MNYQKIYDNIIEYARKSDRKKSKKVLLEKHHIIPKSLGGLDNELNLVLLTPKEHYLCHRLLVEIYKGTPQEHKMYYAMWCMINGLGNQKRHATSSRIYNNLRGSFIKIQSKNRYDNRKRVEQYDLDGNYITSYDSVKTASLKLKIKNRNIENCARGECKTAGGYNWKYTNSNKLIQKITYVKVGRKLGSIPHNKGKKYEYGSQNIKYKKVIQYDKDMTPIKKWDSIYEASIACNISRASIENCARKKSKTSGGFIWRYEV